MQTEGEVWGRENSQSFNKDIGNRFVAGKVGIELVAVRKR